MIKQKQRGEGRVAPGIHYHLLRITLVDLMTNLICFCCRHENVSGFYRVSAYFFSKIICDVIPMRLIPVILFSSITYFMLGKFDQKRIYCLGLFIDSKYKSGTSIV